VNGDSASEGFEGLADAPNRDHSVTQGRWLSPDPLAGDITNPQSLNRYPYAMNNPATFIDPVGLEIVDCPPGTPDGTICVDDAQPAGDGGGNDSGGTGGGSGDFTPYTPNFFNPFFPPIPPPFGSFFGHASGTPPPPTKPAAPKPKPLPDVPLNPFAQAVFAQVYKNLAFLDPEPCGGGLFGFRGEERDLGPLKGGSYVTVTRDTGSGTSVGTLVEAGVGPLSVGTETAVVPASGQVESSSLRTPIVADPWGRGPC
jgi:RHS repeat-associated protein